MSEIEAPARRRNAIATKAAILASARQAFARAGYDGVGVREISQGAGVTAMLVSRYFGSKEQLFADVVADVMDTPSILSQEIINAPSPGEAIARALMEQTRLGATPLDGFRILLHSASTPRAAKIGREQIESHHQKPMADALGGDLCGERAALLLSLVAGFQVMRQMIGLSALAESDPEVLTALLATLIQGLVDGSVVAPSKVITASAA